MSRRGAACAGVFLAASVLALTGCDKSAPERQAEETDIPEELQGESAPQIAPDDAEVVGTPMEERVATIGLINKRNQISREIEMMPGESRRVDDVIIRLSACERTAPWEEPQQTGAFVQVYVNERPDIDADFQWVGIFSGWMFKESPSLNVVEHPIYDVWLKECAMSFPGEEA